MHYGNVGTVTGVTHRGICLFVLHRRNTIRKITPNGVVSTVAGATEEAGIKLGPLPGRMENTAGLAFIESNTLAATERFSVLKIRLDEQVPSASYPQK
jgi:hypothetical protein